MELARIAELLQPFFPPLKNGPSGRSQESAALSSAQLQHISIYIDLLLRWNTRINLTAVREPEAIVTRHFGESLFAARHLFPSAAPDWEGHDFTRADSKPKKEGASAPEASANHHLIDIGSGAGFPGLPIKIYAPHIHLTLVESNQRKATFLREVTRALALTNVNVLAARAEDYPGPPAAVVTLRAVEHFDRVLPVAARLVSPGGRLALLLGTPQLDRVAQLAPEFRWSAPIPIPLSSARILLIGTRPA
jgi:16S rRNA (guanine527-N7)-methyltransferase